MTNEYSRDFDIANPRVGVVIYQDGPYVKLKICLTDDGGNVTHVLRGVALPPDTARMCAQRLTLASFKAEEWTPDGV